MQLPAVLPVVVISFIEIVSGSMGTVFFPFSYYFTSPLMKVDGHCLVSSELDWKSTSLLYIRFLIS